jgi:hypothetical protein
MDRASYIPRRIKFGLGKQHAAPQLTRDSDDLPGTNGFEVRETSGCEWQQVFQTIRLRAENDDGNLAGGQILLIFDALIHAEEDVEFGSFRCFEEVAIFQPGKSGVPDCLALVTRQRVSETLVDTLVDQDEHLGVREQKLFCFFQSGDGRFARNGGKTFQKVFKRFSALEVVEERLDGDARPAEDGSSAKNVRIFDYDSHDGIVSRVIAASAAEELR